MTDITSPRETSYYYSDIEATVKFYDPGKGFGFVEVSDGSSDAYLPAAVVEAAGFINLSNGVVLFCEILPGARNPEVSRIHFVDAATGKVQFLAGRPRPQTVAVETSAALDDIRNQPPGHRPIGSVRQRHNARIRQPRTSRH